MKSSVSQETRNWSHSGLRGQMEPHSRNPRSYSKKTNESSRYGSSNSKPRERSDGDLSVEDVSGQDTGYDADVEVINPYRYEDADSDSNSPSNIPAKSKTDIDRIVDSMRSLDCNLDKDDRYAKMPYKRGVKRKPNDIEEKISLSEVHPSQNSAFEVVEINGRFSPKKPRRSKRLEVQDGDVCSSAATTLSDESPSVHPLSTEGSRGSSEPVDAMDIDNSSP